MRVPISMTLGRQAVVVGDHLGAARHLHECPAPQRRQIRTLSRQQLLAAQEIGGALGLVLDAELSASRRISR
jgi:hypothetical protein